MGIGCRLVDGGGVDEDETRQEESYQATDHDDALLGEMMVLVFDGNLVLGAHVRSNLCFLICLKQLIKLRVVKNRNIFSFMRAQHVLNNKTIKYYGMKGLQCLKLQLKLSDLKKFSIFFFRA